MNEFPASMRELYDFFNEATRNGTDWSAYEEGNVKYVVDAYLERLNLLYKSNQVVPAKKTEPIPSEPKKSSPVAIPKQNKGLIKKRIAEPLPSPEPKVDLVERIPDEIRFIRRFVNLDGKTKSKEDLRSFINSLQRAIVEKKIRKSSPHAKQMEYIQDKLVRNFNVMTRPIKIKIDEKTLESFRELIKLEKIMPSVSYIKRYISLNGKFGVKGRASVLLNAMTNAFEKGLIKKGDGYYKIFNRMHSNLEKFISNKTQKSLNIEKAELNGLNGVLGCDCLEQEENVLPASESDIIAIPGSGVMTVEEARNKKYKVVNISGKWLSLIGKFCLPTQFFVYGGGGSGKTSFVLLFTQYLASLGYKILYVAGEQFDTPTFTELLNRLNIKGGNNCDIVGRIETLNPSDYDFVVLDTKDSLEIDTEDFLLLRKQYPDVSFIVIPHATKSGNFKGKEQWRNIVDVMIEGSFGLIRTGHDKNRWGGAGEMRVFDPPYIGEKAA